MKQIRASHMAISGRGKREGEKVWVKGKEWERKKQTIKNKFKDDTRSLDGLKIERQSMQKLEESR